MVAHEYRGERRCGPRNNQQRLKRATNRTTHRSLLFGWLAASDRLMTALAQDKKTEPPPPDPLGNKPAE